MKQHEFRALAKDTIAECGATTEFSIVAPPQVNWVGRVRTGYTFPNGVENSAVVYAQGIWFHRDFVAFANREAAIDVIKHELAHVFTMPHEISRNAHGPEWVEQCHRLGIEPVVKFRRQRFGL